jgi:hypothetical protein
LIGFATTPEFLERNKEPMSVSKLLTAIKSNFDYGYWLNFSEGERERERVVGERKRSQNGNSISKGTTKRIFHPNWEKLLF